MQVCIYTDGGAHGMGHLRRSAALAWALQRRHHSVNLEALSARGRRLLPRSRRKPGFPDVAVFDLPYEISSHLRPLKAKGVPSVALDYFGTAAPDVTISILERGQAKLPGVRRSGLDYAIIRKEIQETTPAWPGRGVLVIIGGGDIHGVGASVAERVARFEPVTLVEGPSRTNSYRSSLRLPIRHVKNPSDLARRMAHCRWAVTNGGTTMMEMMYLGKTVHVIPQTPHEERLAQFVLSKGAILGMGLDSLRPPTLAQLHKIRRAAQYLIDGNGLQRIVKMIENLACQNPG